MSYKALVKKHFSAHIKPLYRLYKKWKKPLAILFTSISIGFLLYFLSIDSASLFTNYSFSYLSFFCTLGIVVLITVIGHINLSYCWKFICVTKSDVPSFLLSLKSVGYAQIAKYLPGNIAQYVGRVAILKQTMNSILVFKTLAIEALLIIVASSIASAFAYILYNNGLGFGVPVLFSLLLGASILITVYLKKVEWIYVVLLNTLVFFLHGASIYTISLFVFDSSFLSFSSCVFGFSIAFVAGFIIPGAPGGLGVREFIFVLLLGTGNETLIAAIILLHRIGATIGDLLFFTTTQLAYKVLQK